MTARSHTRSRRKARARAIAARHRHAEQRSRASRPAVDTARIGRIVSDLDRRST